MEGERPRGSAQLNMWNVNRYCYFGKNNLEEHVERCGISIESITKIQMAQYIWSNSI